MRVIVRVHAHGCLAEGNGAFLQLWDGEVKVLGVFGFLRRIVGDCTRNLPAILVRRGAFWDLNGCEDDFRFFLGNVHRGFAQGHGERGRRSASRTRSLVHDQIHGFVGLTGVLDLDAIVKFFLAVPVFAAVSLGDDEVHTEHSASRPIGSRRGHIRRGGFRNFCSGRSNDGRDGDGDGGDARGTGFHGLSDAHVHSSLFITPAVDLTCDLSYRGRKTIAILGGFL